MMSNCSTMPRKLRCSPSTIASAKAAACCWSAALQHPRICSLRDDLRTRLGWGLVYQVQALSDEEKAQALQQHAQARGFELPHEVTQYLLRHGRRDLPALLGVLDALDAHCLRLKRGASVPLLKEVMQMAKQEVRA